MTPLPKSPLVAFHRCREPGCSWTPDPKSRASRETQANRHGDQTGHPVEYGMEPPGKDEQQ